MSLYDTALEEHRRIIEEGIADLEAQVAAERRRAGEAESALETEFQAHSATRNLLDERTTALGDEQRAHSATKNLLAERNTRVISLETQIDLLKREIVALKEQLGGITQPGLFDPISYKTIEELRKGMGIPDDVKMVEWRFGDDVMLEEACMQLAADEVLVLPERKGKPYYVDTSLGFRAAGVTHLQNGPGEANKIKIENTYKGRNARTWFAMVRANRGIVAMGPDAVISMSDSPFRMGQQAPQGQMGYWTTPSAGRPSELKTLSSATMRVIETDSPLTTYFANLTVIGRDLGGVAYSGLVQKSGVAKRIRPIGFHRGFLNRPNGETGAVTFNGRYLVENIDITGRDLVTGKRVGTSPIMINSSPGGKIKDCYVHDTVAGPGITTWNSSGKHTWENVRTESASGINLEANREGFEFEWIGGTDFVDYHKGENGRNDRPEFPDAKPGGNTSLHIGVRSPYGSQKITLRGVEIDQGPWPGFLSVQIYWAKDEKTGLPSEPRLQKVSDIQAFDKNGKPIPVRTTEGAAGGV
jgi:hypothetical protein